MCVNSRLDSLCNPVNMDKDQWARWSSALGGRGGVWQRRAGAACGRVEAQSAAPSHPRTRSRVAPVLLSERPLSVPPDGSLPSRRNAHVWPVRETGRGAKTQTETGERQEKEKAEKGEERQTSSAQLPAHGERGGHCSSSPCRYHNRRDARGQLCWFVCVLWCFSPELPSGRCCCRSRALTSCKAVWEVTDWDGPRLFFAGEEIILFLCTKRPKLPLKLLKKTNKTNDMHHCYKSNTVQTVTSFIMLCCLALTWRSV